MRYVVDRIIDEIAVLEEVHDKTKIEINISSLPSNVHEGCVLVKKDEEFILDISDEEIRRKRIQEKFNKVRAKKNEQARRD